MILEEISSKIKHKDGSIGIGLGKSEVQNNKILFASIKFLQEFKSVILKVFLFGTKETINTISKNPSYEKYKTRLIFVESEKPEQTIFEYLNEYKINAIVRGSLSSSTFLEVMKTSLNLSEVYRLALLETVNGFQFFYGPVGIDECNDFEKKKSFIIKSIEQLKSFNISPEISVLSGGRKEDLGRDEKVDKTINEANKIVDFFINENPELEISHDQILIERAIEKKSNLVIAPDGISGNLIYRTLVHLGGGQAFGAIYLGLNKIIIDTSRVGNINEVHGALILALSLIF